MLSLLPAEVLLTLLEVGRLTWGAFPPLPRKKKSGQKKSTDRVANRQKRHTIENSSMELEADTDAKPEREGPQESRRRKRSLQATTGTELSSPAVSPTQGPTPTEARAETRRKRQRRSSVRVVES